MVRKAILGTVLSAAVIVDSESRAGGSSVIGTDRSLITVATLVALYRTDQLRGHIGRALDNGVTKEEIGEVITHIAFYAGWPTAANAAGIAKEVFDER